MINCSRKPIIVRIHNLLDIIAFKLSGLGETRTAHTAAKSNEGSSPTNTQSPNKYVLSLFALLSHTVLIGPEDCHCQHSQAYNFQLDNLY